MSTGPDQPPATDTPQTLLALQQEATRLRTELARLRRDLAQVNEEFSATPAAQLLEANEQLVLSALQAQRQAETATSELDEAARTARLDPLTELPGRTMMLDRIEQALALSRRHGTHLAVLFLDIDGFKQINDTLGHEAGDQVLQLVAGRLKSVVREADTVSRHSGDEFLVLLSEVAAHGDAGLIAQALLHAVAAPARVGQRDLAVSVSMGVAVYPEHGEDATTLIRHADAAMYRAKRHRPGSFAVYQDRSAEGLATFAATLAPKCGTTLLDGDAQAWHQARQRPAALAGAADLCKILSHSIQACRPGIAARHQHLSIELPADEPTVQADPARLTQVFSLLLDSASTGTPQGGRLRFSVHLRPGSGSGPPIVHARVEAQEGHAPQIGGRPAFATEYSVSLPLADAAPTTAGTAGYTG